MVAASTATYMLAQGAEEDMVTSVVMSVLSHRDSSTSDEVQSDSDEVEGETSTGLISLDARTTQYQRDVAELAVSAAKSVLDSGGDLSTAQIAASAVLSSEAEKLYQRNIFRGKKKRAIAAAAAAASSAVAAIDAGISDAEATDVVRKVLASQNVFFTRSKWKCVPTIPTISFKKIRPIRSLCKKLKYIKKNLGRKRSQPADSTHQSSSAPESVYQYPQGNVSVMTDALNIDFEKGKHDNLQSINNSESILSDLEGTISRTNLAGMLSNSHSFDDESTLSWKDSTMDGTGEKEVLRSLMNSDDDTNGWTEKSQKSTGTSDLTEENHETWGILPDISKMSRDMFQNFTKAFDHGLNAFEKELDMAYSSDFTSRNDISRGASTQITRSTW